MWRTLWRWLVAGNPPRDVPTPAEPVDPAPMEEHDEGAIWCRCGEPRSRHGGVLVCKVCDCRDELTIPLLRELSDEG